MSYTLLLVDDDAQFRAEFAESFSEFSTIQAKDAQEALEILRRPNLIDLVIVDVRLPSMNGIELIRKIKQIKPDLGIVVLTGYSSKDIAIEALKAHVDDYLEKPIDIEVAKKVILELLLQRRGKGSRNNYYEDKISQAKEIVLRNSDKKISLKEVAEIICLSPKYFSRLFEEKAGMRFTEFRLKAKIDYAKKLLKNSSKTIDQISDELGYKNTESFIRQFKKRTSFTPTEFRQKKKRF
ncbi:MAG: response regulator [Candidatus Omnitrophica bacterium]|nr:response regulator [Candidatus Omnitrophota bacterium]